MMVPRCCGAVVVSIRLRGAPSGGVAGSLLGRRFQWVHLDSNQGPAGYEPDALTAELWTRDLPRPRGCAVYQRVVRRRSGQQPTGKRPSERPYTARPVSTTDPVSTGPLPTATVPRAPLPWRGVLAGRDRRRGAALLVLALYVALLAWGLARHEIWRDEAQAWLLARSSASPLALLRAMRYEGHPALWHLL